MATSNTSRPSALKPPSQLSKLTAQFGFGSRQLAASGNAEKPPALPPKLTASKLRAPTSHLPMYNSKLLGSKSIGNVSAAVSSELSSVPTFTATTTASSCDNLATKPRSSTSDISAASDASSQTLSSASSISSFKKGVSHVGQPTQTQNRRLLSTRSAFFDASRGAPSQAPDSRFSNRSSSSSNISADSGHNSSSSAGPISSKSTHNLSTKSTVQSANQNKSLLPASRPAMQQSTASAKTANLHTHSANIPQAKKPQTAHIVSTPGPVIVDRGAAAISSPRLPSVPNPVSQFPSMTKFAAHQSQLHSQRMQFFYGTTTSPVSNGHQHPQQMMRSGVPVQQVSATNNHHTYPPEVGHSVVKNGTSGPTIAVPVTRRAPVLKSPAHHGILHPELHKPYKRPTTTSSTPSSGHHQLPNGGYSRYQVLTPALSSAVPNGTLMLANVQSSTQNHNSTYSGYNQSYVRNAVNRLNSNNQLMGVSEPGPPLPPKGITNGYARSYSHPPDVNGNIAPAIPPKGLAFRASNQMDRMLAKQTDRQLTIQEHRSEGETEEHLSLEFADVLNGNVVNGCDEDLSSSEYSSLTYNVRRRNDQPEQLQQQQQPTAVVTGGIGTSKSSPLHRHLYQHHNHTLVQQSPLGKLRAPQLVATAATAAGTVGRTETANSVVLSPPPTTADSRRLEEMSFVAALVSRQQLAAAAAAAAATQQTTTATSSAVADSSHQDDTDVEEELLSCGEDSESVSCASSLHESHHHHEQLQNHHQQHHHLKSTCSPQHHLMSASLCSTASTTSSFCFESNGNASSQDSCTSSGSQTPGQGRKARTESSASCTTLSQESTKDWIDDEIADQPDLFMTSGSPPKEGGHQSSENHVSTERSQEVGAGVIADINGDGGRHSLLLKRHHFHLNFPQPVPPSNIASSSSPSSKTGTPMDDSVTPTNAYPSPLRSANHELESLILQHSPKSEDHYTSLPPLNYSHPHHHPHHHHPGVDRSRSFSFNHANNGQMSSVSPSTTPNGPMSPGGGGAPSFGTPRVANLKKRHSYTAASSTSNSQPVTSTTPSYAIFRRPRPLSFVETADGNLGLDSPSLRAVSQDVIGIKTLLFRLQGVLQNAETQNPFESSIRNHHHFNHQFVSNRSSLDSLHSHERTYSNCSESSDRTCAADPDSLQALREENFDLRQELKLLQEEMIDKDRTIRLLQQQMAKYSTGYVEPINGQTGERRPELTNSTTQTEVCSTEGGINPRALSDGSNGQLVRAWIEENLNVNLSFYEDSSDLTAQDRTGESLNF